MGLWLGVNTKVTVMRMLFMAVGFLFFAASFTIAGTYFAGYTVPSNTITGSSPYNTQININNLQGIAFGSAYVFEVLTFVYLALEIILYFFNIIITPAGLRIKRKSFAESED